MERKTKIKNKYMESINPHNLGIRTTLDSIKEGRMKVFSKKVKSPKRLAIKKVIKKYLK